MVSGLSSKLVEKETHGYISSQRWRNIVTGRVKKLSVHEELYIDMMMRHKMRVDRTFRQIVEKHASRRKSQEDFRKDLARTNGWLARLIAEGLKADAAGGDDEQHH